MIVHDTEEIDSSYAVWMFYNVHFLCRLDEPYISKNRFVFMHLRQINYLILIGLDYHFYIQCRIIITNVLQFRIIVAWNRV